MNVAIVGAGISGLACAYILQKQGMEVQLFEKSNSVGGRMSSRAKDRLMFDIGADHLCNHYKTMKELCAELGVEWEKMRFLKYGIYRNGEIKPVDKVVGWVSRLRLALQYFLLPKGTDFLDLNTAAQYDTDNAYDFLLPRLGKEATDYIIDAFCSAYQFHRADEISVGALYAIMYSLKTDAKNWYLQRTKGGMSALPEALAKSLDVTLGTEVTSVEWSPEKQKVVLNVQGEAQEFDAVVMATPANVSLSLLKEPTEEQSLLLKNTQYAASISVAFRIPTELLTDTTIFWVPFCESRTISSYANESMKGEELVHDGKSLVSVWLHEGYARELMKKTDEEIFVDVAGEFIKVCPWLDSVEHLEAYDLQRWPQAEPKFTSGSLLAVKNFLENFQGQNSIYFTGDYLNAPWTEGALRRGQSVAKQVANDFFVQ